MALKHSVLPDYLTPERRRRYRALPKTYPLFCGVWPVGIGQVERNDWLPEARQWEVLRELESYFPGRHLPVFEIALSWS